MSAPNAPVETGDRGGAQFPTTRWSTVLQAGDVDSPQAAAALERLCRAYWYPVYAELRRRGRSPHDAQDLTQEFFACLLRRHSFAHVRQEKGRFRSYLLGALDYFLSDQQERARAQKRGAGCAVLSLDSQDAEARYLEEPATQLTPAELFDRRWGLALLDQALARLREEYAAAGQTGLFDELRPFLALEASAEGYAAPAARLEMKPHTVAVTVHRLRQRFRDAVRAEVAETLANPADVDMEMHYLFGR